MCVCVCVHTCLWVCACAYLFTDVLPLCVQLVQLLLDVDGKRRLRLFLQGHAHLIDAVEAGLDGVDVVH